MDGKLSMAAFGKFLEDINCELDKLEFQNYDPKDTVRTCSPAKTFFLVKLAAES